MTNAKQNLSNSQTLTLNASKVYITQVLQIREDIYILTPDYDGYFNNNRLDEI